MILKSFLACGILLLPGLHASAIDCSRIAGSLPDKTIKAGTSNPQIPIEHTIVMMQENHSFDNYFGRLTQENFYGRDVDGITSSMENKDSKGTAIFTHHETSHCSKDPKHDWDSIHRDWNNGKNDQFVMTSGPDTIGYYDETDINFYYALANRFAISDRYFSSAMTETYPNRFFMLTGTSFGHIKADFPIATLGFGQKTIFQVLNENVVSWKYYQNGIGYLFLFSNFFLNNANNVVPVADFKKDLASGHLPQVAFIDSVMEGQDEHPSSNIQTGEAFVADRVSELVNSSYWKNSVLFLTYDEGGGFFDHVSPPEACVPDDIPPMFTKRNQIRGTFDHFGLRVPFVAISPYAKPHYVSHLTHDHTSILKFIETKYNLPALTARDANSDDLTDVFDFQNPPQLDVTLPQLVLGPAKCDNVPEPKSKKVFTHFSEMLNH